MGFYGGFQDFLMIALYTDSGVQTDPILTSDIITKEALHIQKPNKLLNAEGNQKRRK
jgi:hypothetical protein